MRLSAAEEAAESARTEGKEAVARGVATEVDGILLHMSDKSPTGYKGVGPKDGGYRARYERHHLGVFESPEEAALAFARHALKAEEDERKRGTSVVARARDDAVRRRGRRRRRRRRRQRRSGGSGGGGRGSGGRRARATVGATTATAAAARTARAGRSNDLAYRAAAPPRDL